MHFHVVTLFPDIITPYTHASIMERALSTGKIQVSVYNPRDYATNKHKKVDDIPYGGGPGMVMMVEPIVAAVTDIKKKIRRKKNSKIKTVLFTPGGEQFTNEHAQKLERKYSDIILICGRYEGIDARVKKILRAHEISVGPYVLSGGELPALTVMDAVMRQVPGVLGNEGSLEESRTASHAMYTRPEVFEHDNKRYVVPKVLLSGNHKEIEAWRKEH